MLKRRRLWKHYWKAHSCKISALQHIFEIFSRKYQDFSGNHLSEFQKILNLSMQFHFKLAKHVHAKFQLSSFYPDGLRQIFDHFWRKFQDASGKLLSEFQKKPNLSMQFYTQLSKAYVHADGLKQIFDLFFKKNSRFS
jgi:hypothetical protein